MSILKQLRTFILATLFAISTNALAAGSQTDFLSKIIGKWRLNLQKLNSNSSEACLEIHAFKPDGSNFVWTPSTDSTTEGVFSIADQPTEKGFFPMQRHLLKLMEKLTVMAFMKRLTMNQKHIFISNLTIFNSMHAKMKR